MAYAGGYAYGYQDGTSSVFTPTTAGHSIPIGVETQGGEGPGHSLWRHYGTPIAVAAYIIYTSGTSILRQIPDQDTMDAADAGSGRGDKMVFPTPGTAYPITSAEVLTIIADSTYEDFVSQP